MQKFKKGEDTSRRRARKKMEMEIQNPIIIEISIKLKNLMVAMILTSYILHLTYEKCCSIVVAVVCSR